MTGTPAGGPTRVLIITFYYPPDLSAGSFRAAALVDALIARGAEVHVLTSSPNRYATVKTAGMDKAAPTGTGVTVTRIRVPAHRSGIADQVRTFAVFAIGAWRDATSRDADIVVASSSRLFSGSLGALIAKRLGKPLYLDIRDIFSETVSHVFAGSMIRYAMPLISRVERWTLERAVRINLVSPPFEDYFRSIVGNRNFAFFTNGIDDLFLNPLPAASARKRRPVVLAAGNIGEGQGLHHIVPGLARANPGVIFRIIGGGSRRTALSDAVARAGVDNVELVDPVPRGWLIAEYASADVLFMHLNDLPAFRRVIPSKLFEYAATGKPVLAGVAGYSRALLRENIVGVETFDPCDVDGAMRALHRLLEGPATFDRSEFKRRFSRSRIMAKMAQDIKHAAESGEVRSPLP